MENPLTLVSVVIQRDRQRNDYCAEIGPDILRAERASDLVTKTRRALEFGTGLRWQRSIVLDRSGEIRRELGAARLELRTGISLAAARGETAQRADGLGLFRGWPPLVPDDGPSPPDDRAAAPLAATSRILPYTDTRWAEITAALKWLDDLATTEDAIAAILAISRSGARCSATP